MTLQTTEHKHASDSLSPIQTDSQSARHESSQYYIAFQQLIAAVSEHTASQPDVCFTLSLAGEDSQFTRFGRSKVRQTGQVRDGRIRLTLISSGNAPNETQQSTSLTNASNIDESHRTATINLPFTGDFAADWAVVGPALTALQQELPLLPVDPYAVLPKKISADNEKRSHTYEVNTGNLLKASEVANAVLEPVRSLVGKTASSLEFSGLYAGGLSYRAYADSMGKRHWFETPSFTLDYSLFGCAQQAVKGTIAGSQWSAQKYNQGIAAVAAQLALLARPLKSVPRGSYRTYLAPAAVGDIIETIVWGGLGEAALRQGSSAFSKLEKGEATLSERFSLQEDFRRISIPRFNSSGEIAPDKLPLIERGRWVNSLVSDRSAKEYGKLSNDANKNESMRAPTVAPGTLKAADILAELGTGLYVSNLHYLNWSDLTAGRITGMTRYACFWVEDGEIVAPIENLRFDDDLYRFLGDGLIALTDQQTFLPAVGTYERRSLGGMWMPGMLIDQFRYTL